MLFINVPHPFSIVLKRFYCSQEVLNKIPKPIENNRKWVWWKWNMIIVILKRTEAERVDKCEV